MHLRHPAIGYSLVELLLALGILSALALAAFVLYPKVMTRVHADADKRAMAAGYINFVQVMRAGGAGQFNRDPNSSDGPLSDNPEARGASQTDGLQRRMGVSRPSLRQRVIRVR